MEGKTHYCLDSSSASSSAVGFLCGVEVSNSSAVEVLNSSAAKDLDDESRWWLGLGVSIFCGVWIYCSDFLWGDGGGWVGWWVGLMVVARWVWIDLKMKILFE